MSEKSIEAEQGVLTESVIIDSGVIGVGEEVHPITNDELAEVFEEAFDTQDEGVESKENDAHDYAEDCFSLIGDALSCGFAKCDPALGFEPVAMDEKDDGSNGEDPEDADNEMSSIPDDDEDFNAALDAALGTVDVSALHGAAQLQDRRPEPEEPQAQQVAPEAAPPERPQLDRAALKQFVASHQAEMNGTAKMAASAPAASSSPAGGEGSVAAAQETMKNVKNGDTYIGDDGKKWKYTVVEFSVVPEDVKDEMADDIGNQEPNLEDSPSAQDAAPYQYSSPVEVPRGSSELEHRARQKAAMTHRRNIAATWEDCKAKEKAKCPWHGAAYMTDQIKKVLMARGLPLGKFAVIAVDPENSAEKGSQSLRQYHLLFSQPAELSDEDSNAVVKDFFASMPNVMFNDEERFFGDAGSPTKTYHERQFELADDFEEAGDIPLGAPTPEEEDSRRDTPQEAEHKVRTRQRGHDWGYRDDPELFQRDYLNMLTEKPSNIVACNEDMLRYATQFPEALPAGITMDTVRAAYDRFKKANNLHKGLSAFILNGEVVPEADALAEAASLGKESEAKKYRSAASEVYDLASQVFGGVQEALATKLRAIQSEIPKLPSSLAINSSGELHHTRYLGKDFTCAKNQFPTNQSGPLWDTLRGLQKLYENQYQNMRQMEMFQQGCEQREPTRAYFGLLAFQKCIRDLKDTANKIGEIQDTFLSAKGPAWAEKRGFKMKKKAPAKASPEQTSNAPESEEKQERTPAKTAGQGKTVQIPGLGTVERDNAIEEEINKAAIANPQLQALNTQQQQIGQKYGVGSPEFKTFYDQARRKFQDFFDSERATRYGEKAKKTQPGTTAGKPEKTAKSTQKAEKKPKAKKTDRNADYLKKFKEISEKSTRSLNGSSLEELFNSGYGVFKDSSGNEFVAAKLPEGKIDTTKPYYVMTSVFKAFGDGMTAKEFSNTLKYQERAIAEKKSKEAEQTDWYDKIFGVS